MTRYLGTLFSLVSHNPGADRGVAAARPPRALGAGTGNLHVDPAVVPADLNGLCSARPPRCTSPRRLWRNRLMLSPVSLFAISIFVFFRVFRSKEILRSTTKTLGIRTSCCQHDVRAAEASGEMGPLGGGQEAVAGWAPWGRREGWEGRMGGASPGATHRCSGEGLGQCEGRRLSTLPAHPANGSVLSEQRIPDLRECRAQTPRTGGSWSGALLFFLLHAEF